MSSRVPRGRGGRKGQQHRATPVDLRSFDVVPASEVTVTRPDGTVGTRPAKAPQSTRPVPRRRGPAVCAMCGDPIVGKVRVSQERGPCRGKPVHDACERGATARVARPAPSPQPKRLSLYEENQQLFAAQDRMREQRQSR